MWPGKGRVVVGPVGAGGLVDVEHGQDRGSGDGSFDVVAVLVFLGHLLLPVLGKVDA